MFVINFVVCFTGVEHKEARKRVLIAFAPIPGTHFDLGKTSRGEAITLGAKEGTTTSYDLKTGEFTIKEYWNSAWLLEFENLGFRLEE